MVIILGSARSGTTWIGKIFDSHPDVLYRHEPDSVLVNTDLPFLLQPGEEGNHLQSAKRYLERLQAVRHPKSSCSLPVFRKNYRGPVANLLYPTLVYGAKFLHSRFGTIMPVPDFITHRRQKPIVPVIKSVNSLGRARLFHQSDPGIKIVHVLRHPCGVVSSRLRGLRLKLLEGSVYLKSLARTPLAEKLGFTLQRLESLTLEEQLAFQWMIINETVMRSLQNAPRYHLVIYDEVCRTPHEKTKAMFRFAGLPVSPQTERFLNRCQRSRNRKVGYFTIIRPSRQAAERWRTDLESRQIGRIMNLVADSLPGRLFT